MPNPPDNHALSSSNFKAAEAEDYSKVINQLLASSLAGRAQLWPRAALVQAHMPSYYKPDTTLYRDTLKKDRRNGKELEYVHSAGTWIEQALCALDLFKGSEEAAEQGRLLYIIQESLLASKEILAMRTSHFHAVLVKGPSMARQLAEIVEAKVESKHSQVESEHYATVYTELSAKYVVEAAKEMAKAEIKKDHSKSKNDNAPKAGGQGK